MQNFTKKKLSGTTSGMPLAIAATATLGTTIHTARSLTDVNQWDELWIAFCNTDTVPRNLTIEFGNAANLGCSLYSLPPQSRAIWLVEGWILQNGLLVTAFSAGTASKIFAVGYVIEIG